METFSALLAICAGNSPVPGEFPAQRPVTQSFDVFFYLRLNKQFNKQSWGWWFETLLRPSWRHYNVCGSDWGPVTLSTNSYLIYLFHISYSCWWCQAWHFIELGILLCFHHSKHVIIYLVIKWVIQNAPRRHFTTKFTIIYSKNINLKKMKSFGNQTLLIWSNLEFLMSNFILFTNGINLRVGKIQSRETRWIILIPAWISNHIPSEMWGEITYPFPNFNEVWEWVSNFNPHFMI